MVEIFLIWTLVNGQIHDVDAFLRLDGEQGCQAAMALWNANKQRVMRTHPDVKIDIVGCVPVEQPNPTLATPERPTL